jgi:hypothetical protein
MIAVNHLAAIFCFKLRKSTFHDLSLSLSLSLSPHSDSLSQSLANRVFKVTTINHLVAHIYYNQLKNVSKLKQNACFGRRRCDFRQLYTLSAYLHIHIILPAQLFQHFRLLAISKLQYTIGTTFF